MKAYVRPDLIQDEQYPPSSIAITPEEWQTLEFKAWNIQGYNEGFEEQYTLLLQHPTTFEVFWAYSIDFEFKD